jgi:hypothetical protein
MITYIKNLVFDGNVFFTVRTTIICLRSRTTWNKWQVTNYNCHRMVQRYWSNKLLLYSDQVQLAPLNCSCYDATPHKPLAAQAHSYHKTVIWFYQTTWCLNPAYMMNSHPCGYHKCYTNPKCGYRPTKCSTCYNFKRYMNTKMEYMILYRYRLHGPWAQ